MFTVCPSCTGNTVATSILFVPHRRKIASVRTECPSAWTDNFSHHYFPSTWYVDGKNIAFSLRTLLPEDTSAPRHFSTYIWCRSVPDTSAEVSRTLQHQYRHVSRHFGNNTEMFKPFLAEHNNVILCYVRLMAWQWCLSSFCRMWRSCTLHRRLNFSATFCHHTVAESFYVYQHQTISQNSDKVTHYEDTKYRRGIKITRFSTNKSLYLANDTR